MAKISQREFIYKLVLKVGEEYSVAPPENDDWYSIVGRTLYRSTTLHSEIFKRLRAAFISGECPLSPKVDRDHDWKLNQYTQKILSERLRLDPRLNGGQIQPTANIARRTQHFQDRQIRLLIELLKIREGDAEAKTAINNAIQRRIFELKAQEVLKDQEVDADRLPDDIRNLIGIGDVKKVS